MAKSRKDDAERETLAIQAMIARGKDREDKKGLSKEESTFTELKRSEDDSPIKVVLTANKVVKANVQVEAKPSNPLADLRFD